MAVLLFANNAQTTLASGIGSGATSVSLAAGTGALFPNPGAGQYFLGTLVDAATGLLNEIVQVTARAGDVLTIVRAQEGTTARAWLAGDTFGNFWTAGAAATMIQTAQMQIQATNYGIDTGAADALAVALVPAPASLASIIGSPIRVKIANTGVSTTPTLNVNGLGAVTIVNPDQSAITPGELVAGAIVQFVYDGTRFQIITLTVQASPAFTAGDAKPTYKIAADPGWVMANDGTIGSAASIATLLASASALPLYTVLWNNVSNTWAAVSGGRGATAAADFAGNKTLAIPKLLGRALAVAGAGSGLTSRVLGQILGEETHLMTLSELVSHTHTTTHQYLTNASGALVAGVGSSSFEAITTNATGGSTPFNVMQPSGFVNFMVKL